MSGAPKVFTIPAAAPFLPTLAGALLDGDLVGGPLRDDPLGLADVTVFLPTRRAARALGEALRARLGRPAVLLPRILPLGDVDEDEHDLFADPADLDLPPAMPQAERLVGLARLVLDWRRVTAADRLLTPSGAEIAIPGTTADALHLAADLLALVDQASTEGIDWTRLSTLVPEDHAVWWQLTMTFLDIATRAWPAHLAERLLADPVDRRNRAADALAARLATGGARGPVIAAGSTGSVPATARLLDVIARLPEGAVVLPGLDLDLDPATFATLTDRASASHPQSAMARLLERMRLDRSDIRPLGRLAPAEAARAAIVSDAMRPADATDAWPVVVARLAADPAGTEAALAGLALAETANEAEEAAVVALALREAIEDPDAVAALVTADRGLARRVCAELRRFGVEASDSAGSPLARTPAGVLALVLFDLVADGFPPDGLAALMKHPMARFGWPAARVADAARALELAVLRGPRLAAGTRPLIRRTEQRCRPEALARERHPALRALPAERLDDARALARRLAEAVEPLEALAERGAGSLKDWLGALKAVLAAVCRSETGADRLALDDGGPVLIALLDSHLAVSDPDLPVRLSDAPACLAALMAGETVRSPALDARVFIWGPLEARMMRVDRLVVGGLVEGVWPMATDTGPWLSRPMRAALDFAPPEVRIGLSAHDFAQALGHPRVLLTRSLKRDGAPTVPTRFLQRLLALLGDRRRTDLTARGAGLVALARALDDGSNGRRAARPAPTPPLAARPARLNVTDIETWIRDPYAVYARRILDLAVLPDLGERPDFGDRGSAVHAALADFARTWTGPMDDGALARLIEIGRTAFETEFGEYPEVLALWWPRFAAAAAFVIRDFEAGRDPLERLAEVSGSLAVDDGFTLVGRADRLDLLPDGRLAIIDFKTGSAPSGRQIATLKAPQLPLEAAIARHGGFTALPPREVAELVHVVLRGIRGKDQIHRYVGYAHQGVTASLDETITEAEERLRGLVLAYRDPAKGYLSRAHPFKTADKGDYDHLARVAEWSLGDGDGDGEGEDE